MKWLLGAGMTKELLVAFFCISVGLCFAGAATHLYQWRSKQQAMLRMDGATAWAAFGNLVMSFVCGPYIMLQVGWQHEDDGTLSMTSVLVSAFVAFGWAFVTGILLLNAYTMLPIG